MLIDGEIYWSATDLTKATECEFALLRELDVKLGRTPRPTPTEDPLLDKIAELGIAHERAELDRLEQQFGPVNPGGGGVARIAHPSPYTPEVLEARRDETLDALKAGADVVYQATVFGDRFHGLADFLVRDGQAYRVCDSKLARHEKPKALLQLAAYADQLERMGVPVADDVELILGNGRRSAWPLGELGPVFRERRERLLALLDGHHAAADAVLWGDPAVLACGRCDVCAAEVAQHRDLLLVAGMRMSQRKKLLDAGVWTIDDLAAFDGSVEHLAGSTLATLRAQAALQLRQRLRSDGTPEEVFTDVFKPDALAVLPAPSPGDMFFDFEGDPMWGDGSADWGLEYLFGVVEAPQALGGEAQFNAYWAHDRAQEKRALEEFIDYVVDRRRQYPDMHIYHYAAYEKSALTRLALRHGTREDEIDDLLRAGVLVDLYAVVRSALRVSQPSYSIKKLEPLYMGDDWRAGDVTDAAASIVQYHAFCAARDSGDKESASKLLNDIRDYNRYDCDSTLGLRDWLLGEAAHHGVVPSGQRPESPEQSVTAAETAELEAALRSGLPDDDRTDDEQALAMLAACVAYNRRELKPFWWAHFDRLATPLADWPDTRDVFVAERAEVVNPWHRPTPRSSLHREVRLVGRWGAGSTASSGLEVKSVYDTPVADCHEVPVKSLLGCSRSGVVIIGVSAGAEGEDVVVIDETLPKEAAQYDALPVALGPGSPPRMGNIDGAIREIVGRVLDADRALHPQPGLDILRRLAPRIHTGTLPRGGDRVEDVYQAVRSLDLSYLAVQGPPGTGKTYVGSRVIARLVSEQGWKVGVVAQSHSVVENLLTEVVAAGVPATRVAKKGNGGAGAWTTIKDSAYARFLSDHADGCVLGGTAWDFTNTNRVQREELDLLVIDEAGQFCLAHTLGVSVAAQRLLLLGDPQQLPQVSQGTHPEPVNASALGWLLDEHATLPEELGYFLDATYRMHPELCEKDSRLSYAGQLHSKLPETTDRLLEGVAPGLEVVRLQHSGRSTESEEEADEVVAQIQRLVGTPWTEGGTTRDLLDTDFLVVAPYNAQVQQIRRALDRAGFGGTPVGTVDKFQGRQAPVVIVSMTASAISDVPRGIDFLLQRNRINVAISRGKWLAVLIRSAELTRFMPTTPASLLQLGAFIGLCEDRGDQNSHAESNASAWELPGVASMTVEKGD